MPQPFIDSVIEAASRRSVESRRLGGGTSDLQNAAAVTTSTTPPVRFRRGDRVRVIDNRMSQWLIPLGTVFTYGEDTTRLLWQDHQLELVDGGLGMDSLLELGSVGDSRRLVYANRDTERFFWLDNRQDLTLEECNRIGLPQRYFEGFLGIGVIGDGIVIKFSRLQPWKIICVNPHSTHYFWGWNGRNLTVQELESESLQEYIYHSEGTHLTVEHYRAQRAQSTVTDRAVRDDVMQLFATTIPSPWNARSVPRSDLISPDIEVSATNSSAVVGQPVVYSGIWPIGTIVKLDLRKRGVKEFILQGGHSIEFPLVKITKYTSDQGIGEIIWIGDVEPDYTNIEPGYFTETSVEEVAEYEKQLAELRPCLTRPPIGVLLKYIGKGEKKGLCALVIAEARDNRIQVRWTSREREGEKSTNDFHFFQISKRQAGAFTPDLQTYCKCSGCNSLRPSTEYPSGLKKIGDKVYCDDHCAIVSGNNYCRNCGNWHALTELTILSGSHICLGCHTTYYRECADCGNWHNVGSMRRNASLDLLCDSCSRYGSEVIREYSFKPTPRPVKMAWENTRYLGIELEIETDERKDIKVVASQIKGYLKSKTKPEGKVLDKLVYFKNDRSLRNGVEIVFHPFTLQALHKHFPIKDFLTYIDSVGGRVSDRCGMHVHVSKKRLSNRQLLNGKWFFHKCQSFLETLSERAGDFHYCEFEGAPGKDPYKQRHGRRTALNVAGSVETLEVRLFKSTLNYSKFMANVQFADVFVDYIQHGGGSAFLQRSTGKQIWEDFLDYSKRNGQYQTMTSWISEKGIA